MVNLKNLFIIYPSRFQNSLFNLDFSNPNTINLLSQHISGLIILPKIGKKPQNTIPASCGKA